MNSPFNILKSKRTDMLCYEIIVMKCKIRNSLFINTATTY